MWNIEYSTFCKTQSTDIVANILLCVKNKPFHGVNMEEINVIYSPAAILGAGLIWAIIEGFRLLLKGSSRDAYKPGLDINHLGSFVSLFSALIILVVLVYLSLVDLNQLMQSPEDGGFEIAINKFATLFIFSFLAIHIFGYSFAGFLNESHYWPKFIDYPYYFFGAFILVMIMADLYKETDLVTLASRAEVIIGVYLFNFKLFKTTHELFPTFREKKCGVRDPIFGIKVFK